MLPFIAKTYPRPSSQIYNPRQLVRLPPLPVACARIVHDKLALDALACLDNVSPSLDTSIPVFNIASKPLQIDR